MIKRGSIVITGASGALGSEVARKLVKEGYSVALLDVEASQNKLQMLSQSLGASVFAHAMNVTSARDWSLMLPILEQTMGPPSGAVLIAGGWRGGASLHEQHDESVLHSMLEVNLQTAYVSLRALLPTMVSRQEGSIVVVGSRAVERPWTSVGACEYAASKAAVVALAQTVAAEVLEAKIRVNAVLPSIIDTLANRAAMPKADFDRWVSPESLSEVIAFLLSNEASSISGASIPVYGRA